MVDSARLHANGPRIREPRVALVSRAPRMGGGLRYRGRLWILIHGMAPAPPPLLFN